MHVFIDVFMGDCSYVIIHLYNNACVHAVCVCVCLCGVGVCVRVVRIVVVVISLI